MFKTGARNATKNDTDNFNSESDTQVDDEKMKGDSKRQWPKVVAENPRVTTQL